VDAAVEQQLHNFASNARKAGNANAEELWNNKLIFLCDYANLSKGKFACSSLDCLKYLLIIRITLNIGRELCLTN
jgi:hypothetical protein